MSAALIARAPGKLFLLGEYAVLDGGPAIVAGVDRYVSVRRVSRDDGKVRIEAPGHSEPLEFALGAMPLSHPSLGFALAAYAHAAAVRPEIATRGVELTIGSQLDGDDGIKLGLGSSAAVTVATVAALLAPDFDVAQRSMDPLLTSPVRGDAHGGGTLVRDTIFSTAWRAHRAAQGGVGSGADVAASTYGGIVRFTPGRRLLPRVAALPRPIDAILLAVWTGAAAATTKLVARYSELPHDARHDFVRASRASVDCLARALRRGSLSSHALDAGGAALTRLANATGLPLLTPRLNELVAIARTHGVAAKPSGAGGGDCGIALTTDPTLARRVRAAWQAAGLQPLDLRLSSQGVTVGAA